MHQLRALKRRLVDEYHQLPVMRRRVLFGALGVTLCMGLFSGVTGTQEFLELQSSQNTRRRSELQTVSQMVAKYRQRREQLDTMQETFERSQLSFEQVTAELDRIVKESIGSDNYDLTKSSSSETVGADYERQEFTLRIRALSVSQLINLLYRLEEGKTPIFLGEVNIIKSPRPDEFSATLQVSSIRKRQAA